MPRSISKTPKRSSVQSKLKVILSNRTGGATEIEKLVIDLFLSIYASPVKTPRRNIRAILQQLRERFSLMANIHALLNYVEYFSEYRDSNRAVKSLKDYRRQISGEREKTVLTAAAKIAHCKSIFTLSNSGIIRKSVLAASKAGWKGEVLIVESRPKKEGAILASILAKAGIPVTLAIDSVMPDLIYRSGAVFLGADAVTQTYFVNKIGSKIAVDYSYEYNKAVFIIVDKSKIISNREYHFSPDQNPTSEITASRKKRLRVENSYFERISPLGRFNYICGHRLIPPSDVKNVLNRKI